MKVLEKWVGIRKETTREGLRQYVKLNLNPGH